MKVQQVSPGIINKIKSLITRVGYLKSDIGIVEDTDTATHTISSGQYVIWKNELYKASAAIPSGDPLSSTNLTAVSDGIANELNSKIDNKIKCKDYYFNNLEFTSGTPGTRALQKSSSLGFTGDIIGVSIIHVENSEVLIPVAFVVVASSTLYLNCYRASGNASASSNNVRVRVSYI